MADVGMKEKFVKAAEDLKKDGYAHVKGFLTSEELCEIRKAINKIFEDIPKDNERYMIAKSEEDTYLSSMKKIKVAYEENVFDEAGNLVVPREESYCFLGHSLHFYNPTFRNLSTSNKFMEVFKNIGMKDPILLTSSVIFKNAKVSDASPAHQDAGYIHTTPEICLYGFWMAIDDAKNENGSLEFIPGTQNVQTEKRYIKSIGEDGKTKLSWNGKELNFKEEEFVKVPAEKGDLVIIHGNVIHRSGSNISNKNRWIYVFHAYDRSVGELSPDNWYPTNSEVTIKAY